MNFYKNVYNQRLHNRSTLLNYTTRYIYFIKTNCIEDNVDSWEKQYIDDNQIDWKLINELINKDFDHTQVNQDFYLAIICYNIFEVFEEYFTTAIRRQKNNCNILIHCKWPLALPNIKSKPNTFNVLPFLTLATNEATIFEIIDIV